MQKDVKKTKGTPALQKAGVVSNSLYLLLFDLGLPLNREIFLDFPAISLMYREMFLHQLNKIIESHIVVLGTIGQINTMRRS